MLVLFAILFLFFLVWFGSLREGLTSQQLYDAQIIINNNDISPDDKIKKLYGSEATVSFVDIPIINILKNSSTTSEQKINALKLYFINLVTIRNNSSTYKLVPNKITSDQFFLLNNAIRNSDFDNPTEQILQIKSIGIKEKSFADIINSTIPDSDKIYIDGGTSLFSLSNQILFSQFS
jgi:hypothetical protein